MKNIYADTNKRKITKKTFLKNHERKILQELRKDSRQSLAKISKKTYLNQTKVFRTYKEFEKYLQPTCIINFQELGFYLRSILIFEKTDNNLNILNNSKFMNNLHLSDNDQIFAEMIFENLGEKYDFLEQNKLDVIKEYEIIKDLKREEHDLEF